MGKVRRGGYIIEWFIGDHQPRHVHVYNSQRQLLGRFDLDRMGSVGSWTPDRKLVRVIADLKKEGRL